MIEFIESVENVKKREDAYKFLDIFIEVTGYEPKMWGPSIIGFGSYEYENSSGTKARWPLVGFSPRKTKISLYLQLHDSDREELLGKFGKHTTGKSCIYVNKLADIDIDILKELIQASLLYMKEKHHA